MANVCDEGESRTSPSGRGFNPGTAQDSEGVGCVRNERIGMCELDEEGVVRSFEHTPKSTKKPASFGRRYLCH